VNEILISQKFFRNNSIDLAVDKQLVRDEACILGDLFWGIDCGEGTQHQLMRAHKKGIFNTSPFTRIERILITHLHGDHWYPYFILLSSKYAVMDYLDY
jgi:ribonuclease BN (tRNA processing enzyme)